MINEAIILAGGLGTRLKDVVKDVPKSMAPINGRPFLEYLLNYMKHAGIEHVVLSVGYKHEIITRHFGNCFNDLTIEYSIEDQPLGTGGGIKKALKKIRGFKTFVFNGDTFFDVNLFRCADYIRIKEASVCIALKNIENTSRYGSVNMDENSRIKGFYEKGEKSGPGFINGGVYMFNKNYLDKFSLPDKFSIEKDFFEKYYESEAFFGMKCQGYFLDIGIPEDYEQAQTTFKELPY